MPKISRDTRREFLKTTVTVTGAVFITGCNTLANEDSGDNSGGTDTGEIESENTSTETADPSYELQVSNLEYDLTGLDTSEANQHDKAYIKKNYSAELEVAVLKNGEETDVNQLSEVRLECKRGEEVATTEDGYVPEYAVRDGQELVVKTEVDGEILEDTVRVSKALPYNYNLILETGNGEEARLQAIMKEELWEVYLETQEGEQVKITEYGTVPRDTVEEGQELILRAEANGEILWKFPVTVAALNKNSPGDFIIDARLVDNGETVLHNWSTPYRFDAEIGDEERVTEDNTYEVNRQAFLDQRAEKRDELASDEILTDHDLELIRESDEFLKEEKNLDEETLMERRFNGLNAAMRGLGDYEGSDANPNATNIEKAMLDNFDYSPVFIGGFSNPKEPNIPSAGDGDGFSVDSQVAYVDGDWFHVGKDYINARHISEIEEIDMAQEQAAQLAVSVLAEFEEGSTGIYSPGRSDEIVETAVTSPVTLTRTGANYTIHQEIGGEINLSDDLAWNTLESIRENEAWTETMAPIELAAAIGNDSEDDVFVDLDSDDSGSIQIKLH